MTVEVRQFETWDWVVFAAMLVISTGIGLFYAIRELQDKRRATTSEYLMGGRNMSLLPVSASILVSYISAILVLGNPAEMYTAGTLFFLNLVGILLAILLAAFLFVPLLYPLKLTSSFEYLELRFNSKLAKLTGTVIMIVQQVLYTGIAAFAPSTALAAVTDFPVWATVVILIGVATLYTFLGGLKAVVWTDTFQAGVMIAGLMVIVIQGAIRVGGMDTVWEINKQWNRVNFWDGNPDPTERHTFWTLVFGGMILWLGAYGSAQPSVMRYSSVPTLRKAKLSVLLNLPMMSVLFILTGLAGVTLFAFYAQRGCDPLSAGQVDNANQLIPLFVMEVLGYPGLPGLFLACLFSGALSTISSNLNALSAVVWEDVCKPLVGGRLSELAKTWVTKSIVVLFGGASVGIAFLAANLGGTVLQISLSFNGAAAGPGLGLFLLGALFPFANWIGCFLGGVVGLAIPLWIGLGSFNLPKSGYAMTFPTETCNVTYGVTAVNLTAIAPLELTGLDRFYKMSYLWFTAIGMTVAIIVGIITSLITNPFIERQEVDSKYLMPIFDRLLCCLPDGWRAPCRCGYTYRDPEDIYNDEPEKVHDVTEYDMASSEKSVDSPAFVVGSENGIRPVSYRISGDDQVFTNIAFTKDGGEKKT